MSNGFLARAAKPAVVATLLTLVVACASDPVLPSSTSPVSAAGQTWTPASNLFKLDYPPPTSTPNCSGSGEMPCGQAGSSMLYVLATTIGGACGKPTAAVGVASQTDSTDTRQELSL